MQQKLFLLILVCCAIADASPVSAGAKSRLGAAAPSWKYLLGTDGQLHSLTDYKDADVVVVVFLCNKCPCARGYDQRLSDLISEYGSRGVQVVGINSNIGSTESMEQMKQRATDGAYRFHYLRDHSQNVARGFGAQKTPHVFILDQNRTIVYSGAFDDNRSATSVQQHYVKDAVNALLQGKEIAVKESHQFGCAINFQ